MTDEFPDLPVTSPTNHRVSAPRTTVLPSGLTVVTEDAASVTTVRLSFPTGGSSAELGGEETGAALVNRCLTFKSGAGLSSARLLRTLETDGATPFATAGRTGASLGFTVAPDKAERLLPLLVTRCDYEKWDVRDATHTAHVLVAQAQANPQMVLTEQLYAAAYGPQSPLGKPFYAPPASPAGIRTFREKNYGIGSAILAATGIKDHDAFVHAVKEGFVNANTESSSTPTAHNTYMGGESRISAPSTGYSHLSLALQAPAQDPALRHVMKYCLALLSSGNNDDVSAFTAPGLVGLYASSPSSATLVDSVATVLTSTPTDELVARAKNLAKADAVFQLDGGSQNLSEVMTVGLLETGGFDPAATADAYDAITTSQVSAAMATALQSNPAVAALGDLTHVPYQAEIKARFS